MARSNRAARRATAAQAKTETTPDEQIVQTAPETTIPEAKALVETEQLPSPEAQATESDAPEACSDAPSETGSAAEAPATTVQDLREAAAVPGESSQAEEAPPMGLSRTSWIVPGPCTKRAGTDAWRSFQCYGTGCTVDEYLSSRGHSSRRKARESLRWDVQRSLVRVLASRPSAEESSGEGAAPSEKEAIAA